MRPSSATPLALATPLFAFSLFALYTACSASSSTGNHATTTSTGAGGLFATTATATATSTSTGPDPDASCGVVTENAKSVPLNLYIAMDKSSSMAGTKWNAATAGLSAFVADVGSTGISAALNFFPLDNNPTCDQFAYKPPVVPFKALPGGAAAFDQAIAATMPNGFATPIYPALGGAILGAKEELDKNPGQAAAVLLVTDGQPQGPAGMCGGVNPEDPKEIAKLAAAGLGFGIRTFAIGLPGTDQSVLDQIAAAGGTKTSILVSSANVQMEFANALATVRGESVPCQYLIPDEVSGGNIDYGNVNVLVTPTGKPEGIVPQDPSCKGDGWKYDDTANPKYIVLCPTTCAALRADFGAKVQVLLGCKTEIK
jgi:hypothetical protein